MPVGVVARFEKQPDEIKPFSIPLHKDFLTRVDQPVSVQVFLPGLSISGITLDPVLKVVSFTVLTGGVDGGDYDGTAYVTTSSGAIEEFDFVTYIRATPSQANDVVSGPSALDSANAAAASAVAAANSATQAANSASLAQNALIAIPQAVEDQLEDSVEAAQIAAAASLTHSQTSAGHALEALEALEQMGLGAQGASGIPYLPAGAGTVPSTVAAKLGERISVLDRGAVAQYDPETRTGTDARAGIQAAIDYAATLTGNSLAAAVSRKVGGLIEVDLCGKTFMVNGPVSLSQADGVWLVNGCLVANPATWPADAPPVVRLGHTTANSRGTEGAGVAYLNIECNGVADGIYAQNLQSGGVEWVTVHGLANYGVRAFGTWGGDNSFTDIRTTKYHWNEANRSDYTKRVGIGISSEQADNTWMRCDPYYCDTPIFVTGWGTHLFHQCHPFNGGAAPPSWTITEAVAAPGGGTRLTVASTAGLVSGDLVVMPWVPGISTDGGKPGVYVVTVVDGTTLDVPGFPFAGAWNSGATWVPVIRKWADEPKCIVLDASARGVVLTGCQIDNGKILVNAGATVSINGLVMVKNGNGYNAAGVEFLTNGVANWDMAGITVTPGHNGSIPTYRLTAINGGSFAASLKCSVDFGPLSKGAPTPYLGQRVVGDGSATAPALLFAGRQTASMSDDGETVSLDSDTGLYHPAEDRVGVAVGGRGQVLVHTNGIDVGDGAGSQRTVINGAAGQSRVTRFQTAGVNRWDFGIGTSAESGSNAGSNFTVSAYDDAGAFLATDLQIDRATGLITLGGSSRAGTRVRLNVTSTTTAPTGGSAAALPELPVGYITININGTNRKIPYYS